MRKSNALRVMLSAFLVTLSGVHCGSGTGTHVTDGLGVDLGDRVREADSHARSADSQAELKSELGSTICVPGEFVETKPGECFPCNEAGNGFDGEGQPIDDGNVCTDDFYDPEVGVVHENNTAKCDDGDPNTINDVCADGVCAGVAMVCPPGDWYEVAGECFLCNGMGTAAVGPGVPVDDGNVCTDDFCDPGVGVVYENNTAKCDDGDPNTINDVCADGVCAGVAMVCPAGDCYEVAGECFLCNGMGTGPVGPGKTIDDGNVCTDDYCHPGLGVLNQPNWGNPCDDGNPKTVKHR